jgi:hypothetical protein
MSDVERLRKFLVREHLFKLVLDIPGDIVELGVFKGTGFSQLLKLREIFIPASNKKVIGFDLFSKCDNYIINDNDKILKDYLNIKKDNVEYFLNKIKLTNNIQDTNNNLYQLIEGDIIETLPKFLLDNPGFRISFLNMDLDIEEPTYIALNLLYDRIIKGGIIVFDEYAEYDCSETNGVDRFILEHPDLKLKTLPWGRSPTAYIIKE